ncbi:frizzled-3 [Wyeomyia smithii]|uniref:frizzled-3 n=1 Tax=Wyeomyia smithii TaxID=174621 RepID=UPI002467C7F7|nr:frizzled-3 [Wyeomyia smithii]
MAATKGFFDRLLRLMLSVLVLDSVRAVEELKCELITVAACQNLVYNMTVASAPLTVTVASNGSGNSSSGEAGDSTGIRSQMDAELLITSLRPVIDSGCSKQALFLFCSSLFPLCSANAPRPVQPCRSLCEQVRKDCFSDAVFSKLWPAYLDCRTLPQPENHGLCMQVPPEASGSVEKNATTIKGSTGVNNNAAVIAANPSVAAVPLKPWSIFNLPPLPHGAAAGGGGVGGAVLHPNAIIEPGATRPPHHSHHHHQIPISGGCPANYSLEYDQCVPKCGSTVDAMYSGQQKEVIEFWTLILSAGCFIFTLMSLVTFWTKATKFEYPDRPLLFMTLCYNLMGLCYLERTILHNPRKELIDLLEFRQECTITSQCLAYYIIKNYLLISATTWWLIFGVCWYLSTAKQWSCEALEKKSGLFHVMAWVVPFTSPIGALLRGNITKYELTNFCTAKGFTEIPALILLLVGAVLIFLALMALKRLKSTWNQSETLSKVFTRVLLFAIVYLIPALSAVICTFFERIENSIEPCHSGATCPVPKKFSLLPTLLKLILTLVGGSTTGIWLWSKHSTDLNKKSSLTGSNVANGSLKTAPLLKIHHPSSGHLGGRNGGSPYRATTVSTGGAGHSGSSSGAKKYLYNQAYGGHRSSSAGGGGSHGANNGYMPVRIHRSLRGGSSSGGTTASIITRI